MKRDALQTQHPHFAGEECGAHRDRPKEAGEHQAGCEVGAAAVPSEDREDLAFPILTPRPSAAGGSSTHTFQALMCVCAQLCLTLCNPMDCSLPGSSVHGIFQARILEQVAIFFCRASSRSRDQSQVSCIAGRCFTTTPWEFPGS